MPELKKLTTVAILAVSTRAFTLAPTSLSAQVTPSTFTPAVTNPYFPLIPGTRFRFRGIGPSSGEVIVTTVTSQSRTIMGIRATVVRDQQFDRGALLEDTRDYYAQDSAGNVWYLGEQTRSLRNGRVVSTAGSWEHGVNGAKAGIVMWADPAAHIGERYRQEFLAGVAEDMGKVLSVHARLAVPYGTFQDCVETEDTTPLEPKVRDHKFYCRGVGIVREAEARGAGSELMAIDHIPRSRVKIMQKENEAAIATGRSCSPSGRAPRCETVIGGRIDKGESP